MNIKPPHRLVKNKNNILFIYFGNKDKEAIHTVRSIIGRRFHKKGLPHWTAPISIASIEALKKLNFTLNSSVLDWLNSIYVKEVFDPSFFIDGLANKLKPYQLKGVQKIELLGGRCLLADDPGLGKTVETIAWCHWKKKKKILVLCPAFAKYNWEDEINYWIDDNSIQIIQGFSPVEITERWVIVNYDILLSKTREDIREDLYTQNWDVCLVDESHYISNPNSIRTMAVQTLVHEIPHVILMSATPGKNRPIDLFVPLNIANNKIFPSLYEYGQKFCDPKQRNGKIEYKGATNTEELHELLTSTIMIRRTKEQVFPQLPKRIRIPVLMEGGKKLHTTDLSLFAFEKMKQAAVKAKIPAMIEWIKNMLKTEDKLIIFGEHKFTIDALCNAFPHIHVRVCGATNSTTARQQAVHKFQRCHVCGIKKEFHGRQANACKNYTPDLSTRLFIGSRAAKESMTLTAANHTIFTEFWWSVDDHKQAEDRAFGRAGDLHGTTNWYLIAKDTIEEHIAKIISLKNERMSMTIDGKGVSKNLLLSALIRKYKKDQK